nr:DUF2975 domain-containing protein [uncultured Flavobacterium sp.]
MKAINTLSYILYLILFPFLLAVPIIFWIGAKLILNINDEISSYKLFGKEVITSENPIPLIATLIIYLLVSIANAYGLILLYKIVEKFKKMIFFHSDIISYLKQMGYIFSLGFLMIYFLKPVIEIEDFIFINTRTNEEINVFIETPLNGLVIGLFFLVLSQVFKEALKQKQENIELKQENELTI